MKKLLLIDGNSIINRAFYGIMGNKMLMTEDGTYTNAVYGFLSILFKELDDINPEYLVVAFDLKAPTHRHKTYDKYKANRHGMPEELAQQMPILKEILKAMNVCIIEKEGYEADDILGTLAKWGQKEELEVTVLTGDRDSFQLIDKNIKVRIPRTKMGKTETEDYTVEKIEEEYGLEPLDLIEVKGLMGDASDNIPGVPGVGEKTAISLIKQYKSIDGVYKHIDEQKGKLKEKLSENKDLAYLSKTLGTIDINAPIEKNLEAFQVEEWNKPEVLEIFKKLKSSSYMGIPVDEDKGVPGYLPDNHIYSILGVIIPSTLFNEDTELQNSTNLVKKSMDDGKENSPKIIVAKNVSQNIINTLRSKFKTSLQNSDNSERKFVILRNPWGKQTTNGVFWLNNNQPTNVDITNGLSLIEINKLADSNVFDRLTYSKSSKPQQKSDK